MLRLGVVLSWLWVISGVVRGGLGLVVAYGFQASEYPRYLGRMTSGESINRGMIYITVGAALGVLCLIAKNTQRNS